MVDEFVRELDTGLIACWRVGDNKETKSPDSDANFLEIAPCFGVVHRGTEIAVPRTVL